MNVKIITCHYAYNYGAVLQTYALCTYLNEHGYRAKVINYRPWYYKGSTKTTNKLKLIIRRIIRIPDNIKSEKIFYDFLTKYIPLTKEYNKYDELVSIGMEADVFVAGSDQIWNFNLPNGMDNAFYLDFIRKGKRVSYAASLGMDSLSNEQEIYLKDRLSKFDLISVRENTAKFLLQKANIPNVKVVMDPVYLLEKSSWEKMMKKPKHFPKEKYIMIIAFNRQKEIFEFGKKMANKKGYKVIAVNTFWEDVLNGTDFYFWNCMPEEYLYLIYHAECIVTNSFHGLSFSLIFNRPVVLFQKEDNGNSRMMDLIKELGADEAISSVHKENYTIPKFDFEEINSNIEKGRILSREFLEKAMSQ